MKNQPIAAGFQDGFKLAWSLGIAGVEVVDYRKAANGSPRLFVERDPREALRLGSGYTLDIESKEKSLVGIRFGGCELVWRVA